VGTMDASAAGCPGEPCGIAPMIKTVNVTPWNGTTCRDEPESNLLFARDGGQERHEGTAGR
jgi:hypothetical protein